MTKDPAALFYIDTWLSATAEMDSDVRGWYLNLILHQYDKKTLPSDLEKLAVLAGVKFSEYKRFEQVFEQVFKHKFKPTEDGRLENGFAKSIIQGREAFKEKRSIAGKKSYLLKFLRLKTKDENLIQFILNAVDLEVLDTKSEQVLEQVFKQNFELYINGNINTVLDNNTAISGEKNSNQFPTPETCTTILPESEKVKAIEIYQRSKYTVLTIPQIDNLWELFKLKKMDGKTFFDNDYETIKHFKNWIVFQKVEAATVRHTFFGTGRDANGMVN